MSDKNEFSYMSYQQMVTDITMALKDTEEVMTKLGLNEQAERAKTTAERTKSHTFSVGIMGEFKRGKSTVINALLGEKIAPADVVPASATLNRIKYGITPHATIMYKDGTSEVVPVKEIANYITKITKESEEKAASVDQAIVEYPCEFCKNNVEIIDTPGLNDDERMDAISESVIPTLDAVVLVLSATSPFAKSEAEFVRNKLMTSDISRVIVLVNFIDLIYDEGDRERLLENIKNKFQSEILDRTAAVYGADSKVYKDTEQKLAGLVIYPISAAKALAGREKGNEKMVEESGILAFEDRLRKLLTEERGALEMVRISTILLDMIVQGKNVLELRMNTLNMDADQFLESKHQAEEEIRTMRAEKNEKKNHVRETGERVKAQISDMVAEKYADLETRLNDYIDNYPIDPAAIKGKQKQAEFQEKVREDVQQEVYAALSDYSEQINVKLTEQMAEEAIQIQEYVGSFAKQLNQISLKIQNISPVEIAAVAAIDGLTNFVWLGLSTAAGDALVGLGGLIEGYRAAGWKGAATGFLTGSLCSVAVGAALLATPLVITALPLTLIMGVAGTMGGKFFTNLIWKKDINQKKVKEIRDQLKESIAPVIASLKEQRLLENWAESQVQSQVDAIVDELEKETELLLTETESTLNSIAADITKASSEREQMMDEYKELSDKLQGVSESLTPILQRATVVGA